MLTVHGAPVSPFVRKALVVLEEKGIPYDLVPVFPFGPNPEFRRISPLGKIPAITEGGHSLCDSSVIAAFLERAHPEPPLLPSDPWEAGRALWIEEYADTAMVNVIGAKIFFPRVVGPRFMNQPADEAAIGRAVAELLPPLFDYLEGEIRHDGHFAGGRFSLADASVASQLVNLRYAGVEVDAARWPKLAAHFAATVARPSFATLLERERAVVGG
ncbi:MAG: glutathione S-transferase family protein [Gemmatimonadota bacterium]